MHLKRSGRVLCACAASLAIALSCALLMNADAETLRGDDAVALFRALKLENPEASSEVLYASLAVTENTAC